MRGQALRAASTPTAAVVGEVAVEEYGYGLGPPTGILILRYPPGPVIVDFPEARNDYVHQVFWSPDGVLAVRRGATTAFVGPGEGLWVRRGVVVEVSALDRQTVLRVCLRHVPAALARVSAGVVEIGEAAGSALVGVARPGVADAAGLAAREALLDGLAARPIAEVVHRFAESRPAREVARALLRDPADPTGLAEWADRLYVSPKTLQREFEREHGMSFSAWRTRTRLRASVAMLPRLSVTETAHRVGYSSASAYVAAFTREFGETPGRYAARHLRRAAG